MFNDAEKQPDGDVSSAIRNSLSASLNNGAHNGLGSISSDSANLQNQLAATSKLALMSPVDYEEVKSFNNSVQDLKSKYIVLKPQTSSSAVSATTTTAAGTLGCNASATVTSNNSNANGKILANGAATDRPNNGTGMSAHGHICLCRLVWEMAFGIGRVARCCFVCAVVFARIAFLQRLHLFCVVLAIQIHISRCHSVPPY